MARVLNKEKFDREADFVVVKPFNLGGVRMRPGDSLDKTTVSVRRHRQLYDGRFIRRAAPGEVRISIDNAKVQAVKSTPDELHSGEKVDVSSEEVPVILQRGDTVKLVTPEQLDRLQEGFSTSRRGPFVKQKGRR